MSRIIISFGFVLSSLIPACASSSVVDELAGESTDDDAVSDAGKADGVDGAYTYFAITHDSRRCASPMCGGYFLARVNRTTTVCHDGRANASCYTPVLDWSETELGADAQDLLVGAASRGATGTYGVLGLVRGRFLARNDTVRPELGRFVVSEAWVADGTGVSDGVFARVKDTGVRCIAAPCPSLLERALNESRSAMIAGVDYTDAGLTDAQIEDLNAALFEPSGIIVAGDRYTIHESGRTAKGRTATQAYHRLR